jgi:hypothetical protein
MRTRRQEVTSATAAATAYAGIADTWRRYFVDRREGMGTTYERFMLHRYFEQLRSAYGIESVLEAPSFGMTGVSGINSIWWAANGATVTVVDHHPERIRLAEQVWHELSLHAGFVCCDGSYHTLPFGDHSFDLSWNFAALVQLQKPEGMVKELARVTRKAAFICMPNPAQLFRLSRTTACGWNRHIIIDAMQELGWTLSGHGFMDAPPWPDIAMGKEDFFRKVGLAALADMLERNNAHPLCIIDHWNGRNSSMERDIMRYSFLEGLPDAIKRFWAHHQYFIFTPPPSSNAVG